MSEPLLQIRDLDAFYGRTQALQGVDLAVDEHEIVVLLGANGAGKTTVLRAISGLLATRGSIAFAGTSLGGRTPEQVVRLGIGHVPQGRGVFGDLTVEENLRVGGFTRSDTTSVEQDIGRWYDVFPRLRERRTQAAAYLSGGEQQMLAIARALMSRPRLLLLDEPSLGLARLVTLDVFATLREINQKEGTAMLLVEQNAELALDVAHRAYVIESGRIEVSGSAESLHEDDAMRRAYLGY
ncbi:ABC transporter ATP-binding protein [Nocardioides sp. KR10-350]|uniref:ABC transporter ATP-binding protein n=1 Tax=Nocardioides cheoyonin TaxID=3156615 RepID=UPI0032B3E7E0